MVFAIVGDGALTSFLKLPEPKRKKVEWRLEEAVRAQSFNKESAMTISEAFTKAMQEFGFEKPEPE
jgi:hypothetical protein